MREHHTSDTRQVLSRIYDHQLVCLGEGVFMEVWAASAAAADQGMAGVGIRQ